MSACDCKICRGEAPDAPISGTVGCCFCKKPITYGATHRGEARALSFVGRALHDLDWAHKECLEKRAPNATA